MTLNTFWNIFLKIMGMWLLVKGIAITLDFYVYVYKPFASEGNAVEGLIAFFGGIIINVVLPCLLIFKSNFIIELLRLDRGFSQDKLEFKANRASTISVLVILFGGYLIIVGLPELCAQLFAFLDSRLVFRDEYEPAWILFYSLKLILGYLLITNSKSIVNLVDKQLPKNESDIS